MGAGPGDPGLLTLKGLECLKKADVVIYDRLIEPRLLEFTCPRAELIYVGKFPKTKVLSQEEINLLLFKKAKEKKTVVRLKGGDALLFSRGAEEAIFLAEHKIPFEVIPGVSSAIAVPAYAGIPLTHRNLSSSVCIFTGHEDPAKRNSSLDWERLSTGVGTLVCLMGMRNLANIVENLTRAGRPKTTPCCIIQWGTLPRQKTVTANLETIVKKARQARLSHPAILVVGEVVKLREKLNWYEAKPLFGKRILITCQEEASQRLSWILRNYGAEVFVLPLIKISSLGNYIQLDSAIGKISDFDWVIFSSQNGVESFIKRLDCLGKDMRILSCARLAAIGPKTTEALEDYGLKIELQPKRFCQEGLLALFGKKKIKDKRFLIICSKNSRDLLTKGLKKLGATVEIVYAYQTLPIKYNNKKGLYKILKDIDVITFTSSSCVLSFFKVVASLMCNSLLKNSLIASIGPVTSSVIRRLGFKVDIQAKEYTKEGLIGAILNYYKK